MSGASILKKASFVADGRAVLRPADGALPGGLLVALGALGAEAHVAAGREDDVGGAGEADGALLAVVAAEEVVRAVDVLQPEGQAAPLQVHRLQLVAPLGKNVALDDEHRLPVLQHWLGY